MTTSKKVPLWTPQQEQIERANLTLFAREVITNKRLPINTWPEFYQWSVDHSAKFWSEVWDFCEIIGHKGSEIVQDEEDMLQCRWFPQARLNYAQNLLRWNDHTDAIIFWTENGCHSRMSWAELTEQVKQVATALLQWGIQPQDRVAAVVPNIPQTVVMALACAAIGATWASCSPDFGIHGIVDRFAQITPKVLILSDGYLFKGKKRETSAPLHEIAASLSSVEHVVLIPYISPPPIASAQAQTKQYSLHIYNDICHGHAVQNFVFEPFPFRHPLSILFSSGTTGVPKCIIHSAGGTLLQHAKEHLLHCDIGPEDRVFYYTTCSWMMWNWLISSLASGATILLFDGNPLHATGRVIFDYVVQEKMTHLGLSAKFITSCMKEEICPRISHNLDNAHHLRTILSTGSSLSAQGFEYVYRSIKRDVCLSSISGGTDIVSCFALGNPILPVYAEEIQCRGLGMAVEVYDKNGQSVVQQKGELVCTKPFPSMPIGLWNDPQQEKFVQTYFDKFPGKWTHGDYAEITQHGGILIHGRSDSTLKPSGVRIGTGEIYRSLENIQDVADCIVIGHQKGDDVEIILFVQLSPNQTLTNELITVIKNTIRTNNTPRHVPKYVFEVSDIPKTKNGKISESAVRDIFANRVVENIESLTNAEVLEEFKKLVLSPQLREE